MPRPPGSTLFPYTTLLRASCTGSNPVICGASDQCHVAGTCDTVTGVCSNPPAADGAPCTDGNACTQTDSRQSSSYTRSYPAVCSSSDQCPVARTCNTVPGV